MYTQDFYIDEAVGNNVFSYTYRKKTSLYVPKLKQIQAFEEIELLPVGGDKVTFEEYDFQGVMQTCYGLKNLYEMQWKGKKLYLVDNHNHVFYFWYLCRKEGIIQDDSVLFHIDEHADTRDPGEYLLKPNSSDLKEVFQYTNFTLNVGNYIIPAQKEGLIKSVHQIRGQAALDDYTNNKDSYLDKSGSIILNLDLDFFEPELDYINYNLKKEVILDIAEHSDIITVCTSPYFINQVRAIEVFKDIFDNF